MIWFYDLEILEIQNVIIFFAQRLGRERNVCIRGGVEDTTFEAKTKNSKKNTRQRPRTEFLRTRLLEAKNKNGRGQGQGRRHNFSKLWLVNFQ